jgi:3',5'-cyclic AMP phosphodiesterase CpdA
MSLILHLSDLHLGSPSALQLDYTDKFGVAAGAGATQTDHLIHTVNAVGRALRKEGRKLDSVVISGDLTDGNHDDGYEAFAGLLGELGSSLPETDRIVVVPGNHDVDSKLAAGDKKKMKGFLDAVRGNYRSPLVKGLDYDDDELARRTGSRGKAKPILTLPDAVVVAINSADYCWTEETKTKSDWGAVIAAFHSDDTSDEAQAQRKQLAEDLGRLRRKDIPKVDKRQLDALNIQLDDAGVEGNAEDDPRLRIAVLHHPIGVAATQEEFKDFDVITNLAEVRSFLYHRGFRLILHGHKHQSYAGWDWLIPPGDELEVIPRRALALGSSGKFLVGSPVCRLIEVCPDGDDPVAGAPRLRVLDVKGVGAGAELELHLRNAPVISLAQPFMSSSDEETPWVVRAKTADAAYQQLRDLPAAVTLPRPVISVVENAASARELPTNFPPTDDEVDLKALVDWWQLARPEAVHAFSGSEFNHGQRLYGRGDAIEKAVRALPSSKAIAFLVDPLEAGDKTVEFPAFISIQLQAREIDGKETLLDIVGNYRKQDLELWWPINMAELERIQAHAVARSFKNEDLKKPVRPGRLIAITSIGVHDEVFPQMAGTVLDRSIDLTPEWLSKLAYLAAHPSAETQPEWSRALRDIGKIEGGGLMAPSIGAERLQAALKMQLELGAKDARFKLLIKRVGILIEHADRAQQVLSGPSAPKSELNPWSEDLLQDAKLVRSCIKSIVLAAHIPWSS